MVEKRKYSSVPGGIFPGTLIQLGRERIVCWNDSCRKSSNCCGQIFPGWQRRFIRDTAKEKNYSVQQEDDQLFWSYGRSGTIHFLDAIRKLKLPVYQPMRVDTGVHDPQAWLRSLDAGWQERIERRCGSADVFLHAKQLRFIGEGITDVTPLQHCREVRELVLTANEIRSIEALRGCQQLKRLYVPKNQLSDLRPLQGLAYLQMVNVSATAVTDLAPLASLPRLAELDMTHTPVRSLAPLKQAKSLKSLALNRPDAEQLRELGELHSLTELAIVGLGDACESDLAALAQLVNLQMLRLEDVRLPDLAFLPNNRKLRSVKMNKTAIGDISALAELGSLLTLELNDCPELGNLEALGKSASLAKITASYQQFARLKDRFARKIDFSSMTGDMTDEEEEIWHAYVRS
ncbi:leucine-rich repeat domain-containing protein [Brevibacillus agri]|uniref:leucine-rich repeat domain-containing protein n=1 Tax=Brevibacillus agri TaxID=51101 RepID=UPI002E220E81|nr:leucine-rich repeat domain-containing protein [Brevibacillus agri]MED1652740.1 leucine-rich repeat domain-containing protein [Brevibacillus agri]MED1690033.1 leucine-rich repeat domain-containing protein [Brevibacillus agri]MED1691347.1 leucine-rich repeat domain-containing protein [Brevibacillus agri]MED1700739.1 leucine-rich repeat domain-containing protein [Brevibacillus agri]